MKVKVFLAIVVSCLLVFSCKKKDSFDVLEAQRQMAGVWVCVEDGEEPYEITISIAGVSNVHIKNLFDMGGEEVVVMNLLSETSSLVPPQTVNGSSIGGTGVISERYRKMTLTVTVGSNTIVIACTKK